MQNLIDIIFTSWHSFPPPPALTYKLNKETYIYAKIMRSNGEVGWNIRRNINTPIFNIQQMSHRGRLIFINNIVK